VSDWLDSGKGEAELADMLQKTPHALAPLPIFSISEMEEQYHEFANSPTKHSFGMGNFSKTLGDIVPSIYPGELVMIMGDTTQGKTAVMQTIARSASPLSTLFFELELPIEAMFERFVQMERGCYGRDVLQGYKDTKGRWASSFKGLQHIMICPEAGITMDTVERYITKSELKFGEHPSLVMIDYMGLVKKNNARGRYEAMADAAEQAKVIAKRTNTIVFMGSQIGRPAGSKGFNTDPDIHDAKGAGELENSANLVLTIGRPEEDHLVMKVKKWTRGKKGAVIDFDFDGAKMQITERIPMV
jgi:replicative DNA helicase